jgi:glutamate carboxypeptidase
MNFQRIFQARQGQMIRLLRTLVHLESPTSDKKAVDACQACLASLFKKAGMKVVRIPMRRIGDLLLIESKPAGAASRRKPLLILAHADTVWPVGQIKTMPFILRRDRAYGPGALDMKAGLVQAYFILRTIRELGLRPRRPIQVFINSAEETGQTDSRSWIMKLARKAWAVLCLEPSLPGGALKVRRKGRLVVGLEAHGRMAHAGSPDSGINAIEELAQQLLALRRLRRAGTTLNFGQVQGGRRANVVADRAWAVLDFRFWKDADKIKIIRALRGLKPALPGARLSFRLESQTPPLESGTASQALFRRVKRIAAGLGIRLTGGQTGGGSDASLASSLGRPTLDGLGPDGSGIHAENEHVRLSSLIQRTALLASILLEL